jgi:hypothetical protein
MEIRVSRVLYVISSLGTPAVFILLYGGGTKCRQDQRVGERLQKQEFSEKRRHSRVGMANANGTGYLGYE